MSSSVSLFPSRPFRFAFPGTALLAAALVLAGCEVHDPHDHNDQETFTTVILAYTNAADSTDKPTATIKFKEGFGHGGDALEKNETIRLKAGATYTAVLTLLDETKSPAADMTEEVEEEGHAHQIFYVPSGAALTVAYADKDRNNRPIGIRTTQTAAGAGTGALKVVLKHLQEGNTLLKNDASTVQTGETDVEVSFNVVIE